ncbi:hypothetical protein SSPS47_27065 [Streptomyces sp. S4.7]|nr:hypothetical protein SSPS47_27065 [Streptomyces sp. S4.7]
MGISRAAAHEWVRRWRIEDVPAGLTYKYAAKHGRLPGVRARHGIGWWTA